jgi:hypothetical protein
VCVCLCVSVCMCVGGVLDKYVCIFVDIYIYNNLIISITISVG